MNRRKSVLLVEGNDDEHTCYAILKHHGVPDAFTIKKPAAREPRGVEALIDAAFPVFLEDPSYSRVGLLIDADADCTARWQSVRGILTRFGYQAVPPVPDEGGTIISAPGEDRPLAGVWIMPDNRTPGMLEDFARTLIPDGNGLLAYAEQCLDGIAAVDLRFTAARRPKAVIHTWLAWQEDPGTPIGLAITKRYLDAESEWSRKLAEWCRRLFVDAPPQA